MSKDSFEGQKVLVAMSGGVDSNAAAIFLRERGFEVSGATMILTEEMRGGAARAGEVCRTIGIDHFVFETKELFVKEVKDSFARKYFSGYTPNPCIVCNSRIKFGAFARKAFRDGFDRIATGHYCELVRDDGGLHLMKGYGDKDQTYFLSMTDPEILKRVIFPVGSMDKETVRKKVRETAFPKADGKDSQDICFVPGVITLRFFRNTAEVRMRKMLFRRGILRMEAGHFRGDTRALSDIR